MSQPVPPAGAPEQSPLGKPSGYCSEYAPALLFPIDRAPKRAELGIHGALPFVGEDLWNAYELSWLNPRGKPVVAMATFRVPATSPRLIESKSLKLYLNSFNGTCFDDAAVVRETIGRDLSAASGAAVEVELHTLDTRPTRELDYAVGELIDTLDIEIDDYLPRPGLLRVDTTCEPVSETLVSQLLKSNCLVTGQPDWGTVVIRYSGQPIDRASLLRYIVSFRDHNEFHEQCVERIFTDLRRYCAPQRLAVWARYTRRGGLDINPFRADPGEPPPDNSGDIRQ
ncbi:NADPH-dependent 7-cyano-7-deazaguanine reductase QueF [Cognatazoarcus halotolerans]|uniref:NADPH-dependent 7-cyano-7-deazaguanine reductase QueF n=1 Tax=Cognatazoarcus halotolerans TaxID=2686016 RepID=UPI00135B883D|nr:NADPH-dependent 7-cyano-7-deazaguanine reductase QueF [Cognatazoarcus halotolerans]MCB1899987.1 NADPH-dependent 7-cyano-7-deazaguanine reductase QueF [Rhodocyclaceae bacterium]MCP5310648.1 NADPH-dependent 7-cyano-7-deazaguanine reductase QueF [Zoogloeaceae bacterium]